MLDSTTKPITSPDSGSMPAGPWRAGVAVMVNDWPPFFNSVDAQGAKPSVLPPSRFAPASVVSTRFASLRNSRPEWSRLSEC